MRRVLLVCLVACGPKPASAPPQPEPVDAAPAATLPPVVMIAVPVNVWVPIACPGDVDGVGGGPACLELPERSTASAIQGCTDANGALRGLFPTEGEQDPALLSLSGGGVRAEHTPPTDPRDKREHQVDLDGDGDPETITLIPHDNRASYGRSLSIVDGHDPLMSDKLDPFPDAADVQLLGTSDVDGDGRRELILYAPDEAGFGIAVQEHWAPAEAYRLDCRHP